MREISQPAGAASIDSARDFRAVFRPANGQVMATDAFDTAAGGP
jgi:hypothetical protein